MLYGLLLVDVSIGVSGKTWELEVVEAGLKHLRFARDRSSAMRLSKEKCVW